MSAESVSESVTGVYEPLESRGGWIRTSPDFSIKPQDCFVSATIVSSNGLRGGERVVGRSASGNGTRRQLAEITSINELSPSDYLERPVFETLVPIDPCKAIRFETPGGPATMRVVDLMTPIGFGQRGLIVAPPRTGKTILLQQMAQGIAANHPDARLIMLLIDERPEEVTHMQRSVRGEVIASSNDKDIESHVRLARLVIDRSKRLVEAGLDVVILMDSLTRLGRAFNAHIRGSGRIMSGGLDIRALTEPKSIFGAARKIEHGGSLTIIASALIDTGSRMDEVIFNEFKGTGNMEIMLSRSMADRRIWPAIDVKLSGTRREELLLTPAALAAAHRIRRSLVSETPERSMELLLETMQKYPTNAELVEYLRSTSPRPGGRGL